MGVTARPIGAASLGVKSSELASPETRKCFRPAGDEVGLAKARRARDCPPCRFGSWNLMKDLSLYAKIRDAPSPRSMELRGAWFPWFRL